MRKKMSTKTICILTICFITLISLLFNFISVTSTVIMSKEYKNEKKEYFNEFVKDSPKDSYDYRYYENIYNSDAYKELTSHDSWPVYLLLFIIVCAAIVDIIFISYIFKSLQFTKT